MDALDYLRPVGALLFGVVSVIPRFQLDTRRVLAGVGSVTVREVRSADTFPDYLDRAVDALVDLYPLALLFGVALQDL